MFARHRELDSGCVFYGSGAAESAYGEETEKGEGSRKGEGGASSTDIGRDLTERRASMASEISVGSRLCVFVIVTLL